ncbi:uncharacterized protein LOC135400890 isoform X2 [Ornithodoros turicata]|uniref:uncharacterized protein LOC135400890 isoform X2 n=1 Tax=Ornithodoros turicata TaxID=34597 RepID=UPI003139B1E1
MCGRIFSGVINPTVLVLLTMCPTFAHCDRKSRWLMSKPNDYTVARTSELCGTQLFLDAMGINSSRIIKSTVEMDNPLDCHWTINVAKSIQSLVLYVQSTNLRTAIFEDICIDYVKVTDMKGYSQLVCGHSSLLLVEQASVNISVHLNPTVSLDVSGEYVSIVATAAFRVNTSKLCPNGTFHCATMDLCVWEGFLCDGVRNCAQGDDEHLFQGSTCFMPMSAVRFIIVGMSLLLLSVTSFCFLTYNLYVEHKRELENVDTEFRGKRYHEAALDEGSSHSTPQDIDDIYDVLTLPEPLRPNVQEEITRPTPHAASDKALMYRRYSVITKQAFDMNVD